MIGKKLGIGCELLATKEAVLKKFDLCLGRFTVMGGKSPMISRNQAKAEVMKLREMMECWLVEYSVKRSSL